MAQVFGRVAGNVHLLNALVVYLIFQYVSVKYIFFNMILLFGNFVLLRDECCLKRFLSSHMFRFRETRITFKMGFFGPVLDLFLFCFFPNIVLSDPNI